MLQKGINESTLFLKFTLWTHDLISLKFDIQGLFQTLLTFGTKTTPKNEHFEALKRYGSITPKNEGYGFLTVFGIAPRYKFGWHCFTRYIGVSKNSGTPKWMVYNGKPYENGWFGGTTIFGNIHIFYQEKTPMKIWVPMIAHRPHGRSLFWTLLRRLDNFLTSDGAWTQQKTRVVSRGCLGYIGEDILLSYIGELYNKTLIRIPIPMKQPVGKKQVTRWRFPIFLGIFNPIPGKWSNLTSIFFKWVGSTTN